MLMAEWVNRLESIDLDRRHVLTLPPTQSMRRLLLLIWCWYPHCDSLSSCHTQSTNANHSRSPLFGWRPRWYEHCQCVCVCTRTGRISLDIVCVPSGKHTHTHTKLAIEERAKVEPANCGLNGRRLAQHQSPLAIRGLKETAWSPAALAPLNSKPQPLPNGLWIGYSHLFPRFWLIKSPTVFCFKTTTTTTTTTTTDSVNTSKV